MLCTKVYFIRHAQADNSVRDGRVRPLTEKGLADRRLVTDFLRDKNIGAVFSSPFRRAVDTVAELAAVSGLDVQIVEDFREQKSPDEWDRANDYFPYLARQWADFNYAMHGGETLAEVQKRNIAALNRILNERQGGKLAVGTHGTSLATIVNYYDPAFGFAAFLDMLNKLPCAVEMAFERTRNIQITKINLL